jgi:hypothetical protein
MIVAVSAWTSVPVPARGGTTVGAAMAVPVRDEATAAATMAVAPAAPAVPRGEATAEDTVILVEAVAIPAAVAETGTP